MADAGNHTALAGEPRPQVRPGAGVTLALVAASHSMTHMYAALMPLIYPPAMAELGFSYTQLGLLLGLGNFLSSALQGIYGFVTRYVLRRVLIGGSSLLLALSMLLTGSAAGFPQFFAFNLLARASTSPQHPVGNSLVSEHFGKKLRGMAFAVNFAGGNAGTVLVPSLGTLAVATLGWRWSMALFALPAVVIGVFSLLAIPEARRPAPVPAPQAAAPSRTRDRGNLLRAGRAGLREFFAPLASRNVRLIVLAASVAAGGRGIGVVMVYVPLYLQQGLGLTGGRFSMLFTIMMVGSVIGPLLAGRLSDFLGRRRMVLTIYILSMVTTLALLLAGKHLALLTLAITALGLVVYGQSSLIQAFLADHTTRENRDMAFSMFFTTSYVVGAVWSAALGVTVDHFGFVAALLLMAISYLAGAAVVLLTGEEAEAK